MPPHSRYRDIAFSIKVRIEAGEWEPGSTLPRLDDLAKEFAANRDTVGRAIALLETDGYVWAVQRRGIIVRHGMSRPRRPRGDLVKRNMQVLGYSFPSASAGEVWVRHGTATNEPARLNDPRIAQLLGVEPGTLVQRRLRVTGPATEPPFQINDSWIHPRAAELVADVDANPAAGEWLYRLEVGGHWPLEWEEVERGRMPTEDEAVKLEISTNQPVTEIVRIGTSGGDGKPVEVTVYTIPADRVETRRKLRRDEAAQQPWPEGNR